MDSDGCSDSACPCCHPRAFRAPWYVFSTGTIEDLAEISPEWEIDHDGNVRTFRRFRWISSPVAACPTSETPTPLS
jgi:hypothetical protein